MPANMSSLWEEEGVGEEVGRGEGMPHSGLPEIKGDGTGAALNCSPHRFNQLVMRSVLNG